MRQFIAKGAVACGTLAVTFLVIEAGFQVAARRQRTQASPDRTSESWIAPDPDLGYRLRPNRGFVNDLGLPNPPIGPKGSRFRVLMLGDSVIYGPESFVRLTEDIVRSDVAVEEVELINTGVPGYTTYQELSYLKKSGLQLEPDLVGFVFVLNDLHKMLHAPLVDGGFRADAFTQRTSEALNSVDNWPVRLARRSLLLQWIRHNVGVAGALFEMYESDGFTFEANPDVNPAWKDASWQMIEALLREAVQLGKQHRFEVFLVAVPYGEQYRKDYIDRDEEYVRKPQRSLKVICDRLAIACLDLLPHLVREDLEVDRIHLTQSGHAKIAERLATFLRNARLLPVKTASGDVAR